MGRGISFEFDSDIDHLSRFVRDIDKRYAPSEAAKALNRVPAFVKREAAADVSQRTGIKPALLRRRFKQLRGRRASPRNLRTAGFVGEATIPVSKLTPKPRKSGRGVTYKTVTGQPHDPRAFHATLKNGKRTAWVRRTAARGSMKEIQVDVRLLLRRAVRRIVRQPARRYFESTFADNMDKRIKREAQKRGITVR